MAQKRKPSPIPSWKHTRNWNGKRGENAGKITGTGQNRSCVVFQVQNCVGTAGEVRERQKKPKIQGCQKRKVKAGG